MLRRSPRHRFLPGYVVFPGGAVEEQDPELAVRWFGDSAEAARACGLRELGEEAGVVLAADGWLAVHDPLEVVEAVSASPPALQAIPEISHWIAPEDVPVRFDARFYAMAAPRGLEPRTEGDEAERAWWARPLDLLEANASGGCTLYWPTMKVLEGLAACRTVDELLAARIPQIEPDAQIVG